MPRRPAAKPSAAAGLGRLRRLVEADGRSHTAIAAAAGLPQPTVSRIVGGQPDADVSTLARILAALGRTWADLD